MIPKEEREKHIQKLRTLRLGKKQKESTKEKLRLAALKQHEEGRCRGGMEARERRMAERKKRLLAGKKPEKCEICGSSKKICFDHDHISNKFRGWICWRCNIVLGFVEDSVYLLEALKRYIQKQL